MQGQGPPPRQDAPVFLPAHCLGCGSSTFMAVRRIQPPSGTHKWLVYCRQCQGWSPGYPLVAPPKGEHTAPGNPAQNA
jgi:hypothetical protein